MPSRFRSFIALIFRSVRHSPAHGEFPVDANPFATIRTQLDATPISKWLAIVGSVLGTLILLLLFPILYLFADLLVTQGRIPRFQQLPESQQQAFRDQWEQRLAETPDLAEILGPIQLTATNELPDSVLWEYRWQAATYHFLATHVGTDAAEAYWPQSIGLRGPTSQKLGILATAVREADSWSGRGLAWFARWNRWTWDPQGGRPVNVNFLTGLFLMALGIVFVRGLLGNLAAYWAANASITASSRLRRSLHTHSYRLSAVVIQPAAQQEAGQLISTRVEQIHEGLHAWLLQSFRWPLLIVAVLAILFVVNFWLTLGLIFLGSLVWLVAGQAAAWFRQDARLASRRAESRLLLLQESLTMMQLVKGYLMERYSQTRLERYLSDLSRAGWRRLRGDAMSRQALLTVVALAGLTMLYLAALVVLGGEMSLAGLLVKVAALGTLVIALNRWITARQRLSRARAAAAEVIEFMDRRGDTGQGLDAEFLQPMSKRLDLVGVSLREPGTGRMILENLSLSIPSGSKSAVVYADQTEAHALVYLIVRFLDPTAGEVKIDGKNIRWVTYESLRTQVGLVLEQSLTFTDTVLTNIGCGDPGFSLPQIIEAAKRVHAHQFIQHLPYGYETPIGDGGVSLTIGQRFRIALARAILRDPSILILEEPSEPIDPDSLALIDDAIARIQQQRTLIVLARRPSTVKSADRVFVLQNGKLAASGRHEELLEGSELYRLLHFKQSLTASETA